jgi:hypothetical protein
MQQPTEVVTLADALDELTGRGFTAQFTVAAGRLRAVGTAKTFGADQVMIREQYRFEGISDPDDMAILYGIETRSGIRGTLADAFGIYADPSVGAFMDGVVVCRGRSR